MIELLMATEGLGKTSIQYELIAGERRFRAAQAIGLEVVPVYILSVDADVEMMEYAKFRL